MFEAQNIDGDTWLVTETSAGGVEVARHKVAVAAGGTSGDAIAAITEALNPPTPTAAQVLADWRNSQALSKMDFAVAMAGAGIITEAEAEGWLDGVMPGVVAAALNTLPEGDRFAARMLIKGATIIRRNDPILAVLAGVANVDAAGLDALFS